MIQRRKTRQIVLGDDRVGYVKVGGDAPVSVQSMTAGYTFEIDKCVAEIHKLAAAGADVVRVAVPEKKDTDALRHILPQVSVPIVADLKTMDGGYLEAEMMAKAGATHVVVMARAHEETVKCVVKAGRDFNIKVMGDNLGCADWVAGARELEDLGCDYVIHHIGYDQRRGIAAAGKRMPSPLDCLRDVVAAVNVPVQAVGGLSIEQAVRTPQYGAPLVVLGAPLTVDADAFRTASGDLESTLRLICEQVHGFGDVVVGKRRFAV